MLIEVKNGDLYRSWINYYTKFHSEMIPAEIRTFAFINSTKDLIPPIKCD